LNVNYSKLNSAIKDDKSKSKKAFDEDIFLSSYLITIGNMINKMSDMDQHELGIFTKSLDTWLRNRNKSRVFSGVIQRGDICMFDWNINYKPELSYFHPGLIIEEVNNMLLVVPASSKVNTISQAYHPDTNPTGNWYNRKVSITDGFSDDCVLLLDNLKITSTTRVINKVGSLTCNLKDSNSLYSEIKFTLIKNLFPHEYNIYKDIKNESQRNMHEKSMIQHENDRLYNEFAKLKKENERIKAELNLLKSNDIT
jgi:hypothetical protein